jgi:hypothetical protein
MGLSDHSMERIRPAHRSMWDGDGVAGARGKDTRRAMDPTLPEGG